MALRFEQQQSCSVPSLSCTDERLLTYSALVCHIHGKFPGLLREKRQVSHGLGSPRGLGISFPLISTEDREREYLLLWRKSCIKYRINDLGKDI